MHNLIARHFRTGDGDITFVRDNKIPGFLVSTGRVRNLRFRKIEK